jgi:hypothetical protein
MSITDTGRSQVLQTISEHFFRATFALMYDTMQGLQKVCVHVLKQ